MGHIRRYNRKDAIEGIKDANQKLKAENQKLRKKISHLQKALNRLTQEESDPFENSLEEESSISTRFSIPEKTCPECDKPYVEIPAGVFLILKCSSCSWRKRTRVS